MYSYEELSSIVTGAFKPLRCVVDADNDYKKKLTLKIFDRNEKEITAPLILPVREFCEKNPLLGLIQTIRAQLEEMEFALEPWELK